MMMLMWGHRTIPSDDIDSSLKPGLRLHRGRRLGFVSFYYPFDSVPSYAELRPSRIVQNVLSGWESNRGNDGKNDNTSLWNLALKNWCKGRDLNPRTPTRIGPEPISFGQARIPLHGEPETADKLLIFNEFDFPGLWPGRSHRYDANRPIRLSLSSSSRRIRRWRASSWRGLPRIHPK